MRHTTITIHQDNIRHNVATLKAYAPKSKLLAMVKACAYGHQLANVLPAMTAADGFGVACMSEALATKACMAHSDTRPIVLIEGVFDVHEWQSAITHQFMCVIHHDTQLAYALSNPPPPNSPTRTIWLKYNTGMNRLGFDSNNTFIACDKLIKAGYTIILTSHFACADNKDHPMNAQQCQAFEQMLNRLQRQHGTNIRASLCNSAGIFNFPNHHYHWVRSGIALYGSSPLVSTSATTLGLKPAMSLNARIIAIHQLTADDFVGYGALWQAHAGTKLGIVSIGYGDGYPRVVNHAYVGIAGQLYPIVGRVAMDMLAVDITGSHVAIGDTVCLWGDTPTLDKVATWAGTIGYELLCRLSMRPTRLVLT